MHQDCDIRTNPNCWGPGVSNFTGVELIYAGGHCHAPSCISMELYHADTGMLLCSHYPVYGETHQVGRRMIMMMMIPMMMILDESR